VNIKPEDHTVTQKPSATRNKPKPTKDKVLQARIPEQLDAQLRDRAEQLGLSVSTIVRNALLHTFELVEGVVTDTAQVGRALRGGKFAAAPEPSYPQSGSAESVLGWQEAVLNLNGVCDTCNTLLPIGQRAAVGIPTQSRPVLLCLPCLAALTTPEHNQPATGATVTKTAKKAPRRTKKSS
jgi:hypothetical protein